MPAALSEKQLNDPKLHCGEQSEPPQATGSHPALVRPVDERHFLGLTCGLVAHVLQTQTARQGTHLDVVPPNADAFFKRFS